MGSAVLLAVRILRPGHSTGIARGQPCRKSILPHPLAPTAMPFTCVGSRNKIPLLLHRKACRPLPLRGGSHCAGSVAWVQKFRKQPEPPPGFAFGSPRRPPSPVWERRHRLFVIFSCRNRAEIPLVSYVFGCKSPVVFGRFVRLNNSILEVKSQGLFSRFLKKIYNLY